MDEQKIYELLSSDNTHKENEGLKLLIRHKEYLMRKHGKQIPHYFNNEDRHSVFIFGIWKLLEKIKADEFEWRGKSSLERFLYRLIERRILNEKTGIIPGKAPPDPKSPTTDKPNHEDILEEVSRIFLEKLGKICQQVLIKRYYEGMKLDEIAEEIGLTHGTTKNNSSRCMNTLKRLIKETPNLGDYLKELLKDES